MTAASKLLKVRVTLTITVDPAKWDNGNDGGDRAKVRDDIKSYVTNHIREAYLIDEAEAEVEAA